MNDALRLTLASKIVGWLVWAKFSLRTDESRRPFCLYKSKKVSGDLVVHGSFVLFLKGQTYNNLKFVDHPLALAIRE